MFVDHPPPSGPLMLYDATCDFCTRWVLRWRVLTGDTIQYVPLQLAAEQFPELPIERLTKAVHLINTDGRVSTGAEAVFRSLAITGGNGWMLWTYQNVPAARAVIDRIYGWVARNRFNG